jgi:hypothetical protein
MATILQLRRGTTTQHNTFTGAVGEVTVDTTKDTVVVHDGTTAGGFPLATEAYVTTQIQTKDNSDEITEGSTNLYFTTTRARDAVSVTDSGGDGSLAYNSSTGVFTFTGPSAADVRAHFSGGTGVTITDGAIATTITQYTDALARGAVSVTDSGGDGSLSYDNSTGVFTFTGPSAADVRAHFSAGTGITLSNGSIATTITQYTDALARSAISAGTGISYDSSTGVITNSITQYADSNARAAISVTDSGGDGSLAYNSSNGVITYTGPSATDVRAHFSGGTGVTITDGAVAIGQAVGTGSNVTFNDLTVSGNLTVSGTTTTINTETINLADNIITLNSNEAGTPSQNAGIEVERGTSTNVTFQWNETTDVWEYTVDGTNYIPVVGTTATQTLSNKTISGSSNTLSNIANSSLTNSKVTIGSTDVSLGGTVTTFAGLSSVTSTSFVGALTGNASTVTNGVYTTDTGSVTNTMLAGSIADTKLSTISTAGKVSNSATTATDANTASAIVARDASGNFTAGTISAALSGNASTATTLATARNINGVSFNGSAAITITANTTNALTIGAGLSGTSFNGSGAVTVAIDSTVATLTGTQTLTNKTISGANNTLSNIANSSLTNSAITLAGTSVALGGSFTATNMLDAIKTVDGAGSGLDADLLDGNSSAHYRINIYNESGTLLN